MTATATTPTTPAVTATATTAATAPAQAPAARPGTPGTDRTGRTDHTGAHSPEAADVIAGARDRIDALDDRIIGLIQERMAVSAVVQDARITSGGRRVNLSREMEILGRYRDALGRPGTALAMTMLELCRGRI